MLIKRRIRSYGCRRRRFTQVGRHRCTISRPSTTTRSEGYSLGTQQIWHHPGCSSSGGWHPAATRHSRRRVSRMVITVHHRIWHWVGITMERSMVLRSLRQRRCRCWSARNSWCTVDLKCTTRRCSRCCSRCLCPRRGLDVHCRIIAKRCRPGSGKSAAIARRRFDWQGAVKCP